MKFTLSPFKRIKERKAAIRKANEERMKAREKIIDDYYNKSFDILQAEADKAYEEDKKECEKHNGICPKCGGKDIVDKVIIAKKTVNYYGLSASSTQDEERIYVNHCNTCGHEWDKQDTRHGFASTDYVINALDNKYLSFFDDLYDFLNEKRNLPSFWAYNPIDLRTMPREYIECGIYRFRFSSYCFDSNKKDEVFGIKMVYDVEKEGYNADKYAFTLTDELWQRVVGAINDVYKKTNHDKE